MTPGAVRERLSERAALIVPVGTTEPHGLHLPLGCDTIIVERLADELSAMLGIVRAPTLEYGVNMPAEPGSGGATLRRRTLHRIMNELIESWEEGAGVREFVILTAQPGDRHLEALSTIRTNAARVTALDIFAMNFDGLVADDGSSVQGGELETSLVLYLAPELARPDALGSPSGASAQKGAELYRFILERISRYLSHS